MSTKEERLRADEYTLELLDDICEHDPFARIYLLDLIHALRIWDDFYDRDSPVSREDILTAFEILFLKHIFGTDFWYRFSSHIFFELTQK